MTHFVLVLLAAFHPASPAAVPGHDRSVFLTEQACLNAAARAPMPEGFRLMCLPAAAPEERTMMAAF